MSKYKALVKDKLSEGHDRASNLKGGVKGKVGGLIPGRNKPTDSTTHVAVPLSSLRDPSSFAPPPKRTNSGLAPPSPPPKGSSDRRLLEAAGADEDEEEEEDRPPPQPYRVNTTGLSTDHLPPPPGRRDGADGRSPPPYDAAVGVKKPPAPAPRPSLPPRLPPRSESGSRSPERTSTRALIPAGSLNQGAVSRLGAAGISVPGFGIGSSSPANADSDSPSPPPPPRPSTTSQLSGLQNRFSKLSTSTSSSSTAGSTITTSTTTATAKTPPSEGTTWAQKQAALKTASSFHKDPSSVSLADAKAAASTTNNFLQRHGDQVAAGIKSANSLNQKYGVADKVGGFAAASQAGQAGGALPGLAGKKKPPPPPPPKKKPGLARDAPSLSPPTDGGDGPPPIPMSTRPVF